ncbi:hypothetical protein DDB_G0280605 [Dictyostelium discoideum AX4]|uniref:Uncharacterized protein n=1 Tax=Dictyostelium discoideum TaxID=44689 RepID=Q54V56_DICDI|nr:hypothetical protein DDB_G0280605 [Dictyostelium discoideum AX4]EAL67104.1 hypothetical protein DDB_G0280605 [Dictyostelium discoideum AX4]|eukprot:XP_641075.1 hypothetical protein DDB_G0280605 [Dictyostelium discoideum AX4]
MNMDVEFENENMYSNEILEVLHEKIYTENELYFFSDIMFNYKFHLSKRKLFTIDCWLNQKSQYLKFIDHLHFDLVHTGEIDLYNSIEGEPKPYRCFSCKKYRPDEWIKLSIIKNVNVYLCQSCGSKGKIYYH